MPAKRNRAASYTSMGRVHRSDLRPRQPQTDVQLVAAAKRAALIAERKAQKTKRAEGGPRAFH